MECGVLPDERDRDLGLRVAEPCDHLLPLREIRFRIREVESLKNHIGDMLVLEHQRRLVKFRHREVLYDAVFLYVAEESEFVDDVFVYRGIDADDDHVGSDAQRPQFLDGVLRRLGLMLFGAWDERYERDVDEEAVFLTDLE